MLASRPSCLCLGDYALASCVFAPCVYMQRQRQETSRQAMEEKVQRVYERGKNQISMIDMASIETRMRANKQEGKQVRKQANKQKGKQAS